MGGSSVNLSVYCKSFMSKSYVEFDSVSLLQIGGVPLSALVSILTYWKNVQDVAQS